MNLSLTGTYFDGQTLQPHAVIAHLAPDQISLEGLPAPLTFPARAVRISDRIADVPRFLYFPNGASLETLDNPTLDTYLVDRGRSRVASLVHWLECRSSVAATAALLLVITLTCLVHFGLPLLARKVAHAVPPSVQEKAGRVGLATLDRFVAPSQLTNEERVYAVQQLNRLRVRPEFGHLELQFRAMGTQPNAFALPGGILVVSDELVRLASSDELTAVLAHEIGHVHHRHGIQQVFQSSAALLLLSAITGDLSTLTTFSATLPATLLQLGYSRAFEVESDAFAVALLREIEVDPAHLATILAKLESTRRHAGEQFSYLSTHPATSERIAVINPGKRVPTPSAGSMVRPGAKFSLSTKFDLTNLRKITEFGPNDTRPKALFQPAPAYPSTMANANLDGDVVVEFIIDEKGQVSELRVVRSSHVDFEEPALEAVRTWRFTPPIVGGKPVRALVSQKLEFKLESTPLLLPEPAAANPSS